MKTKKIGLVGGPSTGKTVFMHQLCAELRKRGKDARAVLEYATNYIARFGPPTTAFEQLTIFDGEKEAEDRFDGRCEYIIAEGPAFLTCIYARLEREDTIKVYGEKIYRHLIKQLDDRAREISIPTFDLVLFLPPLWGFKKDLIRFPNSDEEMNMVSSWVLFFLRHENIRHEKIIENKNDAVRIKQALKLIQKL